MRPTGARIDNFLPRHGLAKCRARVPAYPSTYTYPWGDVREHFLRQGSKAYVEPVLRGRHRVRTRACGRFCQQCIWLALKISDQLIGHRSVIGYESVLECNGADWLPLVSTKKVVYVPLIMSLRIPLRVSPIWRPVTRTRSRRVLGSGQNQSNPAKQIPLCTSSTPPGERACQRDVPQTRAFGAYIGHCDSPMAMAMALRHDGRA